MTSCYFKSMLMHKMAGKQKTKKFKVTIFDDELMWILQNGEHFEFNLLCLQLFVASCVLSA